MEKSQNSLEQEHARKLQGILARKKRNKMVQECLFSLYEQFPHTFFSKKPLKPLQVGLHKAVLLHYREKKLPFSNLVIREAIRKYTYHLNYLKVLTEGARRVDLFGDDAGMVSAEQAKQAKEQKKMLQQRLLKCVNFKKHVAKQNSQPSVKSINKLVDKFSS